MSYKAELQSVIDFYGQRKQERSGVPLINHIHEGIKILHSLYADDVTIAAWCLHPLVQGDNALGKYINHAHVWVDANALVLAMEYRRVANLYLPSNFRNDRDRPMLSPILQVNQMLIADKVQNTKDFRAHKDLYPNKTQLDGYFKVWLKTLAIHKDYYIYLCERMRED